MRPHVVSSNMQVDIGGFKISIADACGSCRIIESCSYIMYAPRLEDLSIGIEITLFYASWVIGIAILHITIRVDINGVPCRKRGIWTNRNTVRVG